MRIRLACPGIAVAPIAVALATLALTGPAAADQHGVELRPGGDPAAVRAFEQTHDEGLRKGPATSATDAADPSAVGSDDRDTGETAPLAGVALAPGALRGWRVVDEARRDLGTVIEVAVDPASGEAEHLIVGDGTGDPIEVPMDAVEMGDDVLVATGR